jgi:hypothetical protein
MYLPYMKVTAKEDRMGNLILWLGDNTPMPKDEERTYYIQTSQERSDLFANCFGFDWSDDEELRKGWTVVLEVHEDVVVELFPYLLD